MCLRLFENGDVNLIVSCRNLYNKNNFLSYTNDSKMPIFQLETISCVPVSIEIELRENNSEIVQQKCNFQRINIFYYIFSLL